MAVRKVTAIEVLNFIILFDLFFCGSGRLIMLGNLSMRMAFFLLAVIYVLVSTLISGNSFETKSLFAMSFFLGYLVFSVVCIGDEPLGIKLDYFFRYAYIILILFYEVFFTRDNTKATLERMKTAIKTMTLLLAAFSIALWIYALSLGQNAYDVIEMGFFRPKVYGNFDFIGGGIPRIFLKASIFVPIGLLFEADAFLDKPSVAGAIKCGIYLFALMTTFTTGLFLATFICGIILLLYKKTFYKKIGILMWGIFAVGMAFVVKAGLINIMTQRYRGDYSTSYRTIQLISIINEFLTKPIFGHGFGHEFTTVYGNTVRTTANFEIAWGEILVDCGIIGFIAFTTLIALVVIRLIKQSRLESVTFVFALSIVLICLESLTNPFINNSIGLTFFAICAGISNSIAKKGDMYYAEQLEYLKVK